MRVINRLNLSPQQDEDSVHLEVQGRLLARAIHSARLEAALDQLLRLDLHGALPGPPLSLAPPPAAAASKRKAAAKLKAAPKKAKAKPQPAGSDEEDDDADSDEQGDGPVALGPPAASAKQLKCAPACHAGRRRSDAQACSLGRHAECLHL